MRLRASFLLPAVAGVAMALAGCNSPQPTAAPTPAAPQGARYANVPAGVTPPDFKLPDGGGCQGDVARWAAIQDNDLKSGHVSQSVYDQIQKDISEARNACNAGQGARASALVRASRTRHGYPAS